MTIKHLLQTMTLSAVAAVLLAADFAFAQDSDAASAQVSPQLLSELPPPAPSLPVQFAASLLEHAVAGASFSFQLPVPAGEPLHVTAVIEEDGQFVNGDRVIFARAVPEQTAFSSLRFVLTAGPDAVFAEITLEGRRWLLEASRQDDQIQGILYAVGAAQSPASGTVVNTNEASHFVIPDLIAPDGVVRPASAPAPNPRPLSLGQLTATSATAAASALEISQNFSEYALYVGESRDVEVQLQFRNTSAQALNRLTADVYFILEDAELLNAPGCSRRMTNTTPRQPILRCELNGTLAPGGTQTLNYQVRVPAKSSPMRLWSTVFANGLRHDANLNVVNNVSAAYGGEFGALTQVDHPGLLSDRLGNIVIDVMALYTEDAEGLYGNATTTRINQLISVANQIYQDSGVGITLRPVHHARVPYQGSGGDMYQQLDSLTTANHPAFSQVKSWRERFGADMVVLFRPMDLNSDLCGLANLGGYRTLGDMTSFQEKDYAYSLVAIDCPISSALVHELGHNMGLTHSHQEDGGGGTFPFATGYGVPGQFTTVMATPRRFDNAARIARFSNPEVSCKGMPCGIDHHDAQYGADAVRALNIVRFQIASYMPTRVPLLPSRQVGRLNGDNTSARIGAAASTDKGLSYVQQVTPAQRLDISADFYVEGSHVGQPGQFHVLADLSAAGLGMVQLNERGEIFGWDGSVQGLVPFSAPAALKPVEYLRILSDFQPINELHGFPLVLFLAYQLMESGDVIYTREPLVVQITPSR
jgi:hypothetical protein